MTRHGALSVPVMLVLAIAFSGCLASAPPQKDANSSSTEIRGTPQELTNDTTAVFVVDGETRARLTLEIADSPEERDKGLMYRRSLPRRKGMLLVYPQELEVSLWMKDTYVPLDIIFIGADRRVREVKHAFPQPSTDYDEYEDYASTAKYVIEVRRGFANETGIEPGTRVRFKLPDEETG